MPARMRLVNADDDVAANQDKSRHKSSQKRLAHSEPSRSLRQIGPAVLRVFAMEHQIEIGDLAAEGNHLVPFAQNFPHFE